jgi:hypothetical protein
VSGIVGLVEVALSPLGNGCCGLPGRVAASAAGTAAPSLE